ncbi:MAG: hypothetical protein LBI13_06755 [Streptococcaceae bacterium]|jgi:tetratricopeptide (TPR) repeat protein|nr:hypothetical protein [Streptococcaceae bacterium]
MVDKFLIFMLKSKYNNCSFGLLDNLIELEKKDPVRFDMILRYLSQIAINRGQLEIFKGNWKEAILILKANLDRNLKNQSEYIGETLGILSVLEYRNGLYNDALNHATQAIQINKMIGDVLAAEQAYKVLVAANDKIGNTEAAEHLAMKLKNRDRDLFL